MQEAGRQENTPDEVIPAGVSRRGIGNRTGNPTGEKEPDKGSDGHGEDEGGGVVRRGLLIMRSKRIG